MTQVKINTKSNYRNLNGQWLEVKEISGKRVTCKVMDNENEEGFIHCDFTLSEVEEMLYNTTVSYYNPIVSSILNQS